MSSRAPATLRRKALVTGASGGIGRAIAEHLIRDGWEVWGTARALDRLRSFDQCEVFHPVVLDLHDRAGALRAFESARAAAGSFEVVVNNAGYGLFAPFDEVDPEEFDRQLAALLTTTVALVRQQVRAMRAVGRGTLVNVSSLAVEFPLPYMAGYNIAKAGLSALSESLMTELAHTEIRIVDFRPGDIRTGFNAAMRGGAATGAGRDDGRRITAAWQRLETNLQTAPGPDRAARDLVRALARNRSGVVRSGGFFQARLAPGLIKLVPEGLARLIRWRYFGLK